MLNRFFGKKEPEFEEDLDDVPRRPRFRRTRSAASESLYADYGALRSLTQVIILTPISSLR
jgi:hypothetical protein